MPEQIETDDADANPAPTSYEKILAIEIEEGLRQLGRPFSGLFLSGLSAGLDIGFGPFLMAVLLTLTGESFGGATTHLLISNAYAVGFIFVVIGRSELFTEHTTLAVVPVLNGEASAVSLARLWGTIYVANILGGAAFAAIAVSVGVGLGTIEPTVFGELAHGVLKYNWSVTLPSAVLAGWLMGLMTWLVAAGRNTISQVFFVWLIATVIGLAKLPHSIAGTVEVLLGLFAQQGVTLVQFGHFLLWSTLGNIIGGGVFVALLKYGHGVRGGTNSRDIDVDVSGED